MLPRRYVRGESGGAVSSAEKRARRYLQAILLNGQGHRGARIRHLQSTDFELRRTRVRQVTKFDGTQTRSGATARETATGEGSRPTQRTAQAPFRQISINRADTYTHGPGRSRAPTPRLSGESSYISESDVTSLFLRWTVRSALIPCPKCLTLSAPIDSRIDSTIFTRDCSPSCSVAEVLSHPEPDGTGKRPCGNRSEEVVAPYAQGVNVDLNGSEPVKDPHSSLFFEDHGVEKQGWWRFQPVRGG